MVCETGQRSQPGSLEEGWGHSENMLLELKTGGVLC